MSEPSIKTGDPVTFRAGSGIKEGVVSRVGRHGRFAEVNVYENEVLPSVPVNYWIAVRELALVHP